VTNSPQPSMRFRVKSRQAFSYYDPGRRGPSTPTVRARVSVLPCFGFPSIRFAAAACPAPKRGASGGGETNAPPPCRRRRRVPSAFRPVSVRFGPGAPRPDDRLSVWDRPRSQAPSTVYAPGVRHAESRAHPSNERCPCGFTRRQNGGSLRPHARSAATSAAAPGSPPLTMDADDSRTDALRRYGLRLRSRLGVTPRRRIDPQPPVLLLRACRHLAPLHVPPQRDQQLPR
jgi:hypothetical protein